MNDLEQMVQLMRWCVAFGVGIGIGVATGAHPWVTVLGVLLTAVFVVPSAPEGAGDGDAE